MMLGGKRTEQAVFCAENTKETLFFFHLPNFRRSLVVQPLLPGLYLSCHPLALRER